MSVETGYILALVVITVGSAGMLGLFAFLMNRENKLKRTHLRHS